MPAIDIAAGAGQSLSATPITKPADAPNHCFLERCCVIPPRRRQMARRALERSAKPEPGVAHGDHHHAPAKSLGPTIALYRHPAALTRVLDDVLAHFAERHG